MNQLIYVFLMLITLWVTFLAACGPISSMQITRVWDGGIT